MPVIIKNGKTYGDRSVTLSKAEYDALSSAEKLNGTVYYIYDSNENAGIAVELTQAEYDALVSPDPDIVYYITDGSVSYPTADDMRYEEGVSVADALDTLNAGLTDLLVTEWFSENGRAISAGSVDDYDFNCAKTGYTLLGVVGTTIASGGACTTVYIDRPTVTTVKYRIRNNGTSAVTPTKIWVLCLYVKS